MQLRTIVAIGGAAGIVCGVGRALDLFELPVNQVKRWQGL